MKHSDWASLWTAPWQAARTMMAMAETMRDTQSVLAVRLPMIATAMTHPLDADRAELGLMVSEKVDAFGRSSASLRKDGTRLRRDIDAQAGDMRRMASGAWFGPMDYWRMAERSMAMTAVAMAMPARALAPIHSGVGKNAKRLARR